MGRPRSGSNTIYVAASNAPARVRGGADYVCDGTNDEEEIQRALNTAKTVLLSEGNFYIGATGIVLNSGNTLMGAGMQQTFLKNGAGALGPLIRVPENLYDSGTATAGGSSTLTDSTKSWTTNALAYRAVVITGGTGAGQVRRIVSNTATQITVSSAWSVTPDNTSTYAVGPATAHYPYRIQDLGILISGTPVAGTATAGSATTITDSGKSWATDAYAGAVIYIYAGTGQGQARIIASNTATVLTVTRPFVEEPDTTSMYVIGPAGVYAGNWNATRLVLLRLYGTSGQCPPFLLNASQYITVDDCRTSSGSYGGGIIIERSLWYTYPDADPNLSVTITRCSLTTPRGPCVLAAHGVHNVVTQACDLVPTDQRGVGVYLGSGYGHVVAQNRIKSIDTTTATVTGTATSGGSNTLTDSGKSWTTDAYVGYTVRITGGTGSGQRRRITANTATQLTVESNWTVTPDNTSTYAIERRSIAGVMIEGADRVVIAGNSIECASDGMYYGVWNVDGAAVSLTGNMIVAPADLAVTIRDDVSGITAAGNVEVTS